MKKTKKTTCSGETVQS